jgi:hypothetical protein
MSNYAKVASGRTKFQMVCDEELLNALRKRAVAEEETMTGVVTRAVEQYLKTKAIPKSRRRPRVA